MLLVATTGVTMNKHYCMGRMQSVAFNQSAGSCLEMAGMDGEEIPMDCCNDVSEEIKVTDFDKTSLDFQVSKLLFAGIVTHATSILQNIEVFNPADYRLYSPPLIQQNIYKLFQTFII